MGKPKLNPCPFCGHPGEMWRNKDKGSSGRITSYVVRCTNPVCIAHTITARRYALEVAEAAWNHRAEAPAQMSAREEQPCAR